MKKVLRFLGILIVLIGLDYVGVRIAQRIAMPDIPEQVPAEIDWDGPMKQLCEIKRALLIYRYQTCFVLRYEDSALENRSVALEYLEPRGIFNPSRLIVSFDYLSREFAQQKRLKSYRYLEERNNK